MAHSFKIQTQRLLLTVALTVLAFLNCGPLRADDFGAVLARGDEFCRRFDEANAVAQYERAHQLDPHNFEALQGLARTSEDFGNKLAVRDPRTDPTRSL